MENPPAIELTVHDSIQVITAHMRQDVVGQERMVERLIIALLADGHVLIEGLPGLAKTRAVKSLSCCLESDFKRIQFTPDLLPSDVTGGEIYRDTGSGGAFEFRAGPVFGNLVLGDEINRAPAKVQSALLEAMEERQVTVAGTHHRLPDLFMVLATQNPIEQEGTYPLPEAQMDRFLMHVRVGYPNTAEELAILKLVRAERSGAGKTQAIIVPQSRVFAARKEVAGITSADAIEAYIVALIEGTRYPSRFGDKLGRWIALGASPRGSLALDACARAHAWLVGRNFVSPRDVQAIAPECLRHRITLSYDATANGVTTDTVIEELLRQVAVVV